MTFLTTTYQPVDEFCDKKLCVLCNYCSFPNTFINLLCILLKYCDCNLLFIFSIMCTPIQAVRKNNFKQFKTTLGNLIKFSIGSLAESAPLDVHCTKAKITFNDPETKMEHHMCLLAWCGFHGRLEFARHLIQNGASMSSVHSPYFMFDISYRHFLKLNLLIVLIALSLLKMI